LNAIILKLDRMIVDDGRTISRLGGLQVLPTGT